jgi:serine/threonine-protein kinase SRPK3
VTSFQYESSSRTFDGEVEGVQTLQQWLGEVYFDQDKKAELSDDHVRRPGHLVGRLLYFEPSSRATAASLLEDPWLTCDG